MKNPVQGFNPHHKRKRQVREMIYGAQVEEEEIKQESRKLKVGLNEAVRDNTKLRTRCQMLEQELKKRDKNIEILAY